MTLSGADLSSNNTAATVTEAVAKDFVIVKASEGLTYVWAGGQQVATTLRNTGKCVGWYHYARVANDPAAEAQAFVKAANAQPGEVLVLDYEPYGTQANPDGSPPILPAWITAFAQTVTSLTRAPCWFYTNQSIGAAVMRAATTEQRKTLLTMPLWKAYYQPTPGDLMGWPELTCWQYDIQGGLDKNTFYGDTTTWRSLGVPGDDMALTDADKTLIASIVDDRLKSFFMHGPDAEGFQRLVQAGNVSAEQSRSGTATAIMDELARRTAPPKAPTP